MVGPAQVTRGTLGLYFKLAAVLVPAFVSVSAVGLSWIAAERMQTAREHMALRIGNAQARVGAGLERYSDRVEWPVDWSRPIVGELMNTLLSNPAVSCVELHTDANPPMLLATAPIGLGCRSKRIDAESVIDLYTEPPTLLTVQYHEQELLDARQAQREFSEMILAGGLIAALLTSWLSFRVVVGRPMTALVRDIEEARNTAQTASRAKSAFMAKMSHELRTPLNAIIGSTDNLLENSRLEDGDRSQLNLVSTASADLLALISDILDVAALEDGDLQLEPVAYDPVRLVRDVANGAEPAFTARGLRLDLRVERKPGHLVTGDVVRMRQVLLNLLDNARRFTTKGRVELSLSGLDDGRINYAVRDTGSGIAPERVCALFTAFEQADNDRSRAFEGAGLGLTICHKIAKAMGGEIDIQSRLGKGTTVTVTVPAPRAVEVDAASSCSRKLHILVAEDNAANRKVLEAFLKKTPHQIDFAENGALAVEAAKAKHPDLVFMDISMPVMDGHEATRHIRGLEAAQDIHPARIVALTANTGLEDRRMAQEAGMDAFLSKPVRRAALEGAIADRIAL